MAKSLKNSLRSNSRSNFSISTDLITAAGAKFLCVAAVLIFCAQSFAAASAPGAPAQKKQSPGQLESHQDLINKAQNLTLQRDRLQTSQVLTRAIQREPKNSVGYRELSKALSELTSVFYTERAQSAFIAGEANQLLKPKEAIDSFQEALRIEEGNVTVLKALARTHLVLGDCDKAEAVVKSAEALDPYSAEVILLRLQTLDCQKSTAALQEMLFAPDVQLPAIETPLKGLQIRNLIQRKDLKKAKALQEKWALQAKDYPEVEYWKFELARLGGTTDRVAGERYVQLCQNLTPRKRKSFNLDVDLCKGKEAVEASLKESANDE